MNKLEPITIMPNPIPASFFETLEKLKSNCDAIDQILEERK